LIDPAAAVIRGSRRVAQPPFCMAGQWVFAVADTGLVKLDGKNLAAPPAAAAAISGEITGLAASVTHDLRGATTARAAGQGMALGTLSPTWKVTLPLGPAGSARRVNPPVIDAGGRVICTASSGMIVALSAETGALQGFYGTRHGAVETPAFN